MCQNLIDKRPLLQPINKKLSCDLCYCNECQVCTFVKHAVRCPGEGRRGQPWRPGGADEVLEASEAGEWRSGSGEKRAGHHRPLASSPVLVLVILLNVILLVLDIEFALTFTLLELHSQQVVRLLGLSLVSIWSSIRSIMIDVRL